VNFFRACMDRRIAPSKMSRELQYSGQPRHATRGARSSPA
jgi:hypothetical protein